MTLNKENKKYILNEFLRGISHISDKNYQIRVWIKGEGPEVDDFDETVNNFSSEYDSIIQDCEDFGITQSQHKILKKFRDRFRNFYTENDFPHEFIDTPEWQKIMDMAKEVLKSFNYKRISR